MNEEELTDLLDGLTDAEIETLLDSLPEPVVLSLLNSRANGADLPDSPLAQALELDEGYRARDHLRYVSDRLAEAVRDVENGQSRFLAIQMPPRTGKTTLTTLYTPLWILRRHPDWPIALSSHDGRLATSWGRQIRRWVGDVPLGVDIAPDAGAAGEWETTRGGKVLAVSVRESFVGRGAKVLVIDDPHKDFIEAHSAVSRQTIWDWWLSVAQLRLEPPALVLVVMTRWHENDLVGRLMSSEYEGDPSRWEVINLPALAEPGDALGRSPGEPLLSPLLDESPEQAEGRWAEVKESVGSYVWSAQMQQRPAPVEGAIFDMSKWRFWTTDPERVTEDGHVVLVDTQELSSGHWLDSWDASFKGSETSDFVVGQRWVRSGANRYLVAQQRGRWDFTTTIARMKDWAKTDSPALSPHGHLVHLRLIEDKANGPAIINVLQDQISGIKPITPRGSKEARARAITPEVESGNVYLPHPSDPGNEWVADLLGELRNFPHDAHDDQVDTLTQALGELRDTGVGFISPHASASANRLISRSITRTAQTTRRRTGARRPVR